jgi:HEAT repeat protein
LALEGLGASGQERDLELLLPFLSSNQEIQLRLASAAAIVHIAGRDPRLLSAQAIAWAERAIGDKDWTVRSTVAGVLGDIASPESLPMLSGMLKDSKAEVRRQAIKSLGRHFEFAAALALRDGLRDQDAEVRRDTLRSLGRIGQSLVRQAPAEADQIREWLYRLFDQPAGAPTVVPVDELVIARGALLRIGDARQLAPLRAMVTETSVQLRELALEQLAEDVQGLVSFLNDTAFSVRFIAARLLAQRGDRRALPVLSEGLAMGGEPALDAFGVLRQLGQRVNLTADMVALLRSGKEAERLQIIHACQYLPPQDVVQLLRIALRDPSFTVRWHSMDVIAERLAALGAAGTVLLRQLAADPAEALRARAEALLSKAASLELSTSAGSTGGTAEPLPAQAADGGQAAPDLGADKGPDSPPAPGSTANSQTPFGRGTLIVTAKYPAQYQVDRLAWQTADGKPMMLEAGPHTLTTLGGLRPLSIVDNQTTTVQLTESKAEQFERTGKMELEHGDPRKAQKLLEKARASCVRGLRNSSACNALSFEVSVYLGQCFDAQERFSEAMLEYQRALQIGGVVQGKTSLKEQAQRAVLTLEPRLGKVILLRRAKAKTGCSENVQWLPPGTHSVTVAGKEQTVVVRARETVRVGECE